MVVVVKSTKNPRSALCKTSISVLLTFFHLLLKASQDKKFVCEEADRTLKVMVDYITPLPLLHKLKTYVSYNNMRISISNCVSKMGIEGMKEFGLASLVEMAAELLKERLPEAREAARNIMSSILSNGSNGSYVSSFSSILRVHFVFLGSGTIVSSFEESCADFTGVIHHLWL
ncbi:hypothetical protein QYF36_018664 [Acer negundo]|nr:hypothetical protein QYF36_018664 [Acer negundo]